MALSFCVHDINQKLHATWICLLNDKKALTGIKFCILCSSNLEIPLDLCVQDENPNFYVPYTCREYQTEFSWDLVIV